MLNTFQSNPGLSGQSEMQHFKAISRHLFCLSFILQLHHFNSSKRLLSLIFNLLEIQLLRIFENAYLIQSDLVHHRLQGCQAFGHHQSKIANTSSSRDLQLGFQSCLCLQCPNSTLLSVHPE